MIHAPMLASEPHSRHSAEPREPVRGTPPASAAREVGPNGVALALALGLQRNSLTSHTSAERPHTSAAAARLGTIQHKLLLGATNDPLEREADHVADRIMRSSDRVPAVQRRCACGGVAGPDGECAECAGRRKALQRSPAGSSVPTAMALKPTGPIDTLGQAESKVNAVGGGRPLSQRDRVSFEHHLGVDLSGVRVHDDAAADDAARAVGAVAYARGSDLVFRRGTFAPETASGRRLLAHELAHVVQQGAAVGPADVAGSGPGQLLQRAVDEDGKEAGPARASESPPATPDVPPDEAARIGREALASMGYEEVIARAVAAGLLRSAGSSEETELSATADPGVIRRQFAEVFTRYAVAAGIASQVDSPAPGPGDVVAIGILVVGLVAATAAVMSTPARLCPPCPAPPAPEIDRVPPSTPHFPCPGDHWHYYVYNQNPVTCQCFGPRRMFGGCCGLGGPGAPC